MTETTQIPTNRRGPTTTEILRLVVTLDTIQPVISRTLLISESSSLSTLHTAIQCVMPWEHCHLHEFVKDEKTYGPDHYAEMVDDVEVHSERKQLGTLFAQGSDQISYLYDFGDHWRHTIRLEERLPPDQSMRHPRCSAGENACPPEDVGGADGYMHYLEAILMPTHPEHAEMLQWRGKGFDPSRFDLDDANARLAQSFGFGDESSPDQESIDSLLDEIASALPESLLESDDAMASLLATLGKRETKRAPVDFLGLSSEQMHRLLHCPLDSPDIVVLPEVLDVEPAAPVLSLFDRFSEACGEKGLKATQKGKMPRAFVRELAAEHIIPEAVDPYQHHRRQPNSESDMFILEALRYLARFSGLIVYRKGRFHQSAKLKKLHRKAGNRAIYPQLLHTWATQFNWGWADGYPPLHIIQQSWVFNLFMMQHLPADEQAATVISDGFLRAFPMALEEMNDSDDLFLRNESDVENALRRAIQRRVVEHFAILFGLLDSRLERVEKSIDKNVYIKPTPLLRDVARFDPVLLGRQNLAQGSNTG